MQADKNHLAVLNLVSYLFAVLSLCLSGKLNLCENVVLFSKWKKVGCLLAAGLYSQ